MSPLACLRLGLALWLLLVGCKEHSTEPAPARAAPNPAPAPAPAYAANVERGRALVESFECQRCHDGTGLSALPKERHCVRCHEDVEAGKLQVPPAKLAEWKR